MDKLMLVVIWFTQALTLFALWCVMRELRLLGGVVERIRNWTTKR